MLARYLAQNARGKPVRYALDPMRTYLEFITRAMDMPHLAHQAEHAGRLGHPAVPGLLEDLFYQSDPATLGPLRDIAEEQFGYLPGTLPGGEPHEQLLHHINTLFHNLFHNQGFQPTLRGLFGYNPTKPHPTLLTETGRDPRHPTLTGRATPLGELLHGIRQHPIRDLTSLFYPLSRSRTAQSYWEDMNNAYEAIKQGKPAGYTDFYDLLHAINTEEPSVGTPTIRRNAGQLRTLLSGFMQNTIHPLLQGEPLPEGH